MPRIEKPAAALQPFVRYYVHVEGRFEGQAVDQPVPARTAPCIEFTFGDPYEVWSHDRSRHETAHSVAVIGAQTYRRVHLAMRGRVETFVIVFQPGGLSRLFDVAANVLTNQPCELMHAKKNAAPSRPRGRICAAIPKKIRRNRIRYGLGRLQGRAICPSCGARRMAECAALLVDEVLPARPLRQWVLSLPFALRFLLAREPDVLTHVLAIVYGEIASHIRKKARLTRATGATGAVTLIQRFGSALNLNVHFHMLFLDGAYLLDTSPPVFRRIGAPSAEELGALVARIAERIGRALERTGWLARDCETSYLALDPASGGPMDDLIGHSIAYRVAMGPRAGQKAFTLQTVPPQFGEELAEVARAAGFSLHAGVGIEAEARGKLERLCRYVSRPAVAEKRLALTERGDVRVQLKTAYRDGTTHIVLEPLDFLARLAALVPPPRMHLTRYHGVFAPHHALRAAITPAGRGCGARPAETTERPVSKHVAMSWAQRLKRVFAIDVETCRHCGGTLRVIASIEDPALIERILAHLAQPPADDPPRPPFAPRAPPQPLPLC